MQQRSGGCLLQAGLATFVSTSPNLSRAHPYSSRSSRRRACSMRALLCKRVQTHVLFVSLTYQCPLIFFKFFNYLKFILIVHHGKSWRLFVCTCSVRQRDVSIPTALKRMTYLPVICAILHHHFLVVFFWQDALLVMPRVCSHKRFPSRQ